MCTRAEESPCGTLKASRGITDVPYLFYVRNVEVNVFEHIVRGTIVLRETLSRTRSDPS